MNQEELESMRAKWVVEEDAEEEVFEWRPCFMEFSHAGRYVVRFGNQGFDTSQFGEFVAFDEDGRRRCRLQSYVTEPDVAYYDGELELQSRPAYDVMLLARDFYKDEAFIDLDEAVGGFFAALRKRDAKAASRNVQSFDAATGEVVFDANAVTGTLVFDLKLTPAA